MDVKCPLHLECSALNPEVHLFAAPCLWYYQEYFFFSNFKLGHLSHEPPDILNGSNGFGSHLHCFYSSKLHVRFRSSMLFPSDFFSSLKTLQLFSNYLPITNRCEKFLHFKFSLQTAVICTYLTLLKLLRIFSVSNQSLPYLAFACFLRRLTNSILGSSQNTFAELNTSRKWDDCYEKRSITRSNQIIALGAKPAGLIASCDA